MFEDKVLQCRDCGNEFVFTAGEQEFYKAKGFENEPTRCRDCRAMRRTNRGGGTGMDRPSRELYPAVCASCGIETEVPFRPVSNRPVYCRECFVRNQEQAL